MKNSISYTAVAFFLARASFIGMSFQLLANYSKQDVWLSIIIGVIIGILPLLLLEKISKYEEDKTFREKCISLFPKTYPIVIFVISLGVFIITVINFWNLANLITNQFLNKTPRLVIWLLFSIPLMLLISKKKNIIARVSLVLFYISIILFILSIFDLLPRFEFNNLKPILNNSILPASFVYLGFNFGPLMLMLLFKGKDVKNGIRIGYITSAITILITSLAAIGVLGINLSLLYRFPEFHILKNTYEGLLSYQLENILAIQWLFDIFIFCTVGIKFCNETLNIPENYKVYILPIIMIICSNFIFKNSIVANNFLFNYLSFLLPFFFLGIILIVGIKVLIKKNRKNPI